MTGCQSATQDVPRNPMAAPPAVAPVSPSPNPAAVQDYRLALRFAGLPAAPGRIRATADFEVDNLDCVPKDYGKAVGGVRLAPRHSVELALEPMGDGAYAAVLYADALRDEDYYGLGVCRWALRTATVHFHSPATHFVGGLDAAQIESEATIVQHYLVRDFATKPDAYEVVYGEAPGFYQESAGAQFTLTLAAAKDAP